MNRNILVKILVICLVSFFLMGSVSAQTVSDAPPSLHDWFSSLSSVHPHEDVPLIEQLRFFILNLPDFLRNLSTNETSVDSPFIGPALPGEKSDNQLEMSWFDRVSARIERWQSQPQTPVENQWRGFPDSFLSFDLQIE